MLKTSLLLIGWLIPHAGALRTDVAIHPRAVSLPASVLDEWLDRNQDRLDIWLGLQPSEFSRAVTGYGGTEAFIQMLDGRLAGRSTLEQKKYLFHVFQAAWANASDSPLTKALPSADLQAIYRYLMTTHGLPHRSFPSRAEALAFVARNAPGFERNVVEFRGAHLFVFTYDAWSKLPATERERMIVPSWDVSTRLAYDVEVGLDQNDEVSALAKRLAGGGEAYALEAELRRRLAATSARTINLPLELLAQAGGQSAPSHAVSIAAGKPLELGDVLIYSDAAGRELRRLMYVADGQVVTMSGEITLAPRAQDERLNLRGTSYRLTVLRGVSPGVDVRATKPSFYEEHTAAPVPSSRGGLASCLRGLLGR